MAETRVTLRAIREDDLPDWVRWLNDSEVTEFTAMEVGMVTLEDVTKVPEERRSLTFAKDVMSRQLVSIPAEAEAMDALQLMSSRDIGRLVVMQVVMDNGAMVGIVTRTDLLRAVNMMAQAKGMKPIPQP